jgi:hypothetical protein
MNRNLTADDRRDDDTTGSLIHRLRNLIRRLRNSIRLTPARTVAAIVIAAAVAAGAGYGIYRWTDPPRGCGPGVVMRGPQNECTGVTDGSYVFAAQLAKVEAAILAENHAVDGKPHATIALLMPLDTSDPADLHAVQGAYTEQYRANHDNDGQVPLIKLVLANPGVNSAQWLPVAEKLATMTGEPDNLRAVIGISVSTQTTQQEVGWLTARHIPVVGGTITANNIANRPGADPFPGLVRVAPTNTDEAAALSGFGHVNPAQALLVEDKRAGDDYITSLKNAFSAEMKGAPLEPYQFSSPANINLDGTTSNQFSQMVVNICGTASSVKWIYFAGRQVQLRQFINELGNRPCTNRSFTVLTGDAASHLINDPQLDRGAFGRGVTLEYAALAYPGVWTSKQAPATGGSAAGYNDFAGTLHSRARGGRLGPVDLTDGQAIIAYDAALTGVTAIRRTTTPGTPMPSLPDIANEWPDLNGALKIDGASGWICLDNSGNPYDKAIPIVRYNPKGPPTFVAVAWPAGAPPAAACTIPAGG